MERKRFLAIVMTVFMVFANAPFHGLCGVRRESWAAN